MVNKGIISECRFFIKVLCDIKGYELNKYKYFIKIIIIVVKFLNCEIFDFKIYFYFFWKDKILIV